VITTARIAGGLCGLVVVIGLLSQRDIRKGRLGEIQLATSPQSVQAIVGDQTVQRSARRALAIDYAFLTAYWAAFVTLGALIWLRGGVWTVLAVATWITASATAGLDVVENLRTTALLDRGRHGARPGQPELNSLRRISLAKWGASGVTVALLSGVYARHGWWSVVAIGVFLLVAILGFGGLYRHALINVFLVGVTLLSALTAFALQIDPRLIRR
jgi:hypothetical protein